MLVVLCRQRTDDGGLEGVLKRWSGGDVVETPVPRANATAETAVATTREVVDVAVAKSRRWQRQRRGVGGDGGGKGDGG